MPFDGCAQELLAWDRGTVRTYDTDGHLHVADSAISKATVNPYVGREVVGWEKLGLDPDRIYQLLRHPDEMAKAAPTFAGKPVMIIHRGSTANDHPRSLSVGSIGEPVRFDGSYLRAPLHLWDQEAIDGIEDNSQRELSCGYRYDADMTPGEWQGQKYDGVMRNIEGNHVALVKKGRAGPDVFVGDEALPFDIYTIRGAPSMAKRPAAPQKRTRTEIVAAATLLAGLRNKLAEDATIDLAPALKGVTGKTWPTLRAKLLTSLPKQLAGKLAQDADLDDLPQILEIIDAIAKEDVDVAGDPPVQDEPASKADKARALVEGKLSPEDLAALMEIIGSADPDPAAVTGDEPPPFAGKPNPGGKLDGEGENKDDKDKDMVSKQAMDAAINAAVRKTARETETATITKMRAMQQAENAVRPIVGDIAMDEATCPADYYRLALDAMEVEHAEVPDEGVAALFKVTKGVLDKAKAANPPPRRGSPHMAVDSGDMEDIRKRFPGIHTRTAA